jgi:thiol-disulfide isomerase/thioredoxin
MSRPFAALRRSLPWLLLGVGILWGTHGFAPDAHFAVGQRLPPFTAQLSDGSTFQLATAPHEVLVLSFWASYCEPCKMEAPMLSRVQNRDVRVVGLSVEPLSSAEVSRRARAIGMRYPVGLADPELMQRFRVQTLPTTYVIAADGVITLSRVGAISEGELSEALTSARRHAG